MATKVSIANQALSWLGADHITVFTDDSAEAAAISANYDGVRDAVLEEKAWTFATRRITLTPVQPPPEFGYSHAFILPTDTLRIITARNDGRTTGPNTLDWALEDNRVVCNAEKIYVKYLYRADDPLKYSPGFVQAFAGRLAAEIAITLTGSRTLQGDMWKLYQSKLAKAGTNDGRQGREQRTGTGRWLAVRGAAFSGSSMGPYV